jgi:Undecaprenyl-phosphate glucose phosphotransferase
MDFLSFFDLVACIFAGELALSLYAYFIPWRHVNLTLYGPLSKDIIFGSVVTVLVMRDRHILNNPAMRSASRLVFHAERRGLTAFFVLIGLGLATRATDIVPRFWVFSWLALFSLLVGGSRIALGWFLKHLHESGMLREVVAIVGMAGIRERIAARIGTEAHIIGVFGSLGVEEAALLEREDGREDGAGEDSPAEDLAQLLEIGREGGLDAVILAMERGREAEVAQLVERLKALPIQVAICPDESWPAGRAPNLRMLGGVPMAVVADRPLQRWDMFIKTVLDKIGAFVLLVVLFPLLVAIGLAVGLTSEGPIIFRQKRRGWFGRDFTVYKFRTMRADIASSRPYQTLRQDARCTKIGRLLRRTSLDELPQLWNVLIGDMSLVGPRPHAETLHELDPAGREIVAEYAQRNRVKPGITGWAQIHGARGATSTIDQLRLRVEYDLYYIDNWSLWLDVQILARTPFCLVGDNAF